MTALIITALWVLCALTILQSVTAWRSASTAVFAKTWRPALRSPSCKKTSHPTHLHIKAAVTALREHKQEESEVVPAELGGKWRKFDIPNKLTVARVLCIPLFIVSFVAQKMNWAFWTFVAASVTDFVDGYLARKWKQTSPFGAFLDPVADKLMVSTAMILLCSAYPSFLYTVPIALILCREIAISALREWMGTRGIRDVVQVGKLGKIKTTLQMIAMVFLLLVQVLPKKIPTSGLFNRPNVFAAGALTLYLSTIATLWSGGEYLLAAWPTLTMKNKEQA